ncbi:MAG: ubiquitin-like small modifier protein 1 [Bacillota bacterium]
MSCKVRIPAPLRRYTGDAAELHIDAATVGDLVKSIEDGHPGFAAKVLDDKGQLRRFINIYVNQEDIRFAGGLGTPLKDGDEVSIIPAIAGGAG